MKKTVLLVLVALMASGVAAQNTTSVENETSNMVFEQVEIKSCSPSDVDKNLENSECGEVWLSFRPIDIFLILGGLFVLGGYTLSFYRRRYKGKAF